MNVAVPTDRLLLDTHAFLWWRIDDPRLTDDARLAIAEAELVYVSAASAWECAIKIVLGRLQLPEPFEAGVLDSGFERLLLSFAHAEALLALPMHHRDPFDRMLVAQARHESLTLVTHDASLGSYAVDILWT